jgi:hypothetical protein
MVWRANHRYFAFCDPSGGRHDAFTISVAHREGELTVIDCVRGVRPPFDPHEVVLSKLQAEMSKLLDGMNNEARKAIENIKH